MISKKPRTRRSRTRRSRTRCHRKQHGGAYGEIYNISKDPRLISSQSSWGIKRTFFPKQMTAKNSAKDAIRTAYEEGLSLLKKYLQISDDENFKGNEPELTEKELIDEISHLARIWNDSMLRPTNLDNKNLKFLKDNRFRFYRITKKSGKNDKYIDIKFKLVRYVYKEEMDKEIQDFENEQATFKQGKPRRDTFKAVKVDIITDLNQQLGENTD